MKSQMCQWLTGEGKMKKYKLNSKSKLTWKI